MKENIKRILLELIKSDEDVRKAIKEIYDEAHSDAFEDNFM